MNATVDGYLYTTSGELLAWALIGLGLCLGATVVLVALGWRWPRRVGRARTVATLLAVVPPALLGLYDAIRVLAGLVSAGSRSELRPWRAFGDLMLKEVGAAFGASCLLLVVGVVLATRRPEGGSRFVAAALVVFAIAGGAVGHVGLVHVGGLESQRSLPTFAAPEIEWFHAGQTVRLETRLARRNSRWTVKQAPPLEAEEPGEVTFEQRATSRWATASRQARVLAKLESGNPGLPLSLGARWEYSRTKRTTSVVFWFPFEGSSPPVETALALEVTDSRVVRGVREFEITRTEEGKGVGTGWFYAVDGETYSRSKRREDQPISRPWEDDEYGFAFLGSCKGVARPVGEVRIPGPCECRASGTRAGSVIVAVLTLGMFAPGMKSYTYRLERSTPGPAGAPRPLGDPPLAAPEKAVAPSCPAEDLPDLCVSSRVFPYDFDRARRLAEVLRGRGLDARVEGNYFVVRASPADLGEHLGLEVEWRRARGRCPGDELCLPRKGWKRTPSVLRRHRVNMPLLGGPACE